jgi:hypothetical protein
VPGTVFHHARRRAAPRALRVVGEIVAEELDEDDPRRQFITALPAAWDKPDRARWEAARHMLEHDVDYANEPPLRDRPDAVERRSLPVTRS